jgi:hypothetical protein
MITNRELIEGALKRVNARLGLNGKLYSNYDGDTHTLIGWFVKWNVMYISEDAMSADELLAYLHGIEDCFNFMAINKEG